METDETFESEEPESASNPQLPVDLACEAELMKGDAIGNTLYSERFVLKTLIKLTQVEELVWSEDLESNLCYLWDMTIEKDVVELLMRHDFLKIATTVLTNPLKEPRFLEIIVGILRNMCCVKDVRKVLETRQATTNILIQLLSSDDTLTLVQLVRLFQSVAWDLVKQEDERNSTTDEQHWLVSEMDSHHLCERLSFMLSSSTSEELLCSVLEFLNTLCIYGTPMNDKDFSTYFATKELVAGHLECWYQLFSDGCDNEFQSKEMFKAAKKWTAILASFSGTERGRKVLICYGEQFSRIMTQLLWLHDDRCEDLFVDVINILEAILSSHFVPETIPKLLKILQTIVDDQCDNIAVEQGRLILQESVENYFESVVREGSKVKLCESLDSCEEHLGALFWSVVEKRNPELVCAWRSDMKPIDDERSV